MATGPAQQEFEARAREVTGETYILTLLQGLVRQRVLVGIRLPDSDIQYTSTVLNLDTQDKTLLLDELFPLQGHTIFEKTRQLSLFAHLDGAAVGFTAQLVALENDHGLTYYRLQLPQSIHYLQRRDGHRVRIAMLEVHAELYDHQGKVHRALVHDISTGGVSLKLTGGEEVKVSRNDIFQCTLHLPGEAPYSCSIDVNSKRHDIDKALIIGGSFVGLEKRDEHNLWRMVAELERKLLRQRWGPTTKPQKKPEQQAGE